MGKTADGNSCLNLRKKKNMKKRNEVIATILFCEVMAMGSFSVNAEQESQNEAGSRERSLIFRTLQFR